MILQFREMTPPVDAQKAAKKSRSMEDDARAALEKDGCLPCYPLDLEFPLKDVPEIYRGIISYWLSLPQTGDVVLCAQLLDWEEFRNSQTEVRRRIDFDDFAKQVRDRCRRHKLNDDVCLHPDPRQQTPLENWVEFQDYHLRVHEKLEKRRNHQKGLAENPKHANEAAGLQQVLEAAEEQVGKHRILLQWISQEHLRMLAMHPQPNRSPVEEHRNDMHGALEARLRRHCRNRPQSNAVLGGATVSKFKARGHQKATKSGRITTEINDSGLLQKFSSPKSGKRESKPHDFRESPFRRLHPRRGLKPRKFANATAKLYPTRSSRLAGQEQAPDRPQSRRLRALQQQHSSPVVKTRSGRLSRKPIRYPAY